MKNIKTHLIAIFLIGSLDAFSQAKITSYVEQTNVSPKIGTAFTYDFDNYLEIGIFYQKSAIELEKENGRPTFYEKEFAGVTMSYPLHVGDVTLVKLNARTGVVNKENFLITPSIQGEYYPLSFIAVSAGLGVRNFRPTYQAGIKIILR